MALSPKQVSIHEERLCAAVRNKQNSHGRCIGRVWLYIKDGSRRGHIPRVIIIQNEDLTPR